MIIEMGYKMKEEELRALIDEGEHSKLDFKIKVSLSSEHDKAEFAKDVSAMANTRGGTGHILMGVEHETRRIIGIDPHTFDKDKMHQIIASRCRLYVEFFCQLVDVKVNDRQVKVGVLSIPESRNKPHTVTDKQTNRSVVYVRRGATTEKADAEEIIAMHEETRNIESKEQRVNALLKEEGYGLVGCVEEEGWLGIIICPFVIHDFLIPSTKDWADFIQQAAVDLDLIPIGSYNHGPYQHGFLTESPLKRWFIKTRDNGLIHYGTYLEYPNDTVSRDYILVKVESVLRFAQKVLNRVSYEGRLKVVVALSNAGNKRLVSNKVHILEDRYYTEGVNLTIEEYVMLSDLATDFQLVVTNFIRKLCRAFHMQTYDE